MKIGKPYTIRGKTYRPKDERDYRETGMASWYGPNFHGRPTANGERFDQYAMSAAHRTLPLPSWVRVENLENGREVTVRVNDRGPFAHDRIIDLSRAAAREIDLEHAGVARVAVTRVYPDSKGFQLASAQDVAPPGTPEVATDAPVESGPAVPPAETPAAVAPPVTPSPTVPPAAVPPASMPPAATARPPASPIRTVDIPVPNPSTRFEEEGEAAAAGPDAEADAAQESSPTAEMLRDVMSDAETPVDASAVTTEDAEAGETAPVDAESDIVIEREFEGQAVPDVAASDGASADAAVDEPFTLDGFDAEPEVTDAVPDEIEAEVEADTASGAGNDGEPAADREIFLIQVAALREAGALVRLAAELGARADVSTVSTEDGPEGLTRVRVGPYPDRATAETVLAKLREAGYQDAVLLPAVVLEPAAE